MSALFVFEHELNELNELGTMAAKDYTFGAGCFDIYLTKKLLIVLKKEFCLIVKFMVFTI